MKEKVTVIGTLNMELFLQELETLPQWGQQRHAGNCKLVPAGSGPRVVFPLKTLGVDSYLIGKVGDDIYGQEILDVLKRYKLSSAGIESASNIQTGVCACLVRKDGERALLGFLGSVNKTDEALIHQHYNLIKKTDFLLVTGYWNLPGLRKGTKRIFRKAKSDGKYTLLDPGWNVENWPQGTRKEILELLPFVDTFLPNKEEAMILSGKDSAKEIAQFFLDAGAKEVIIKLGGEGGAGCSAKEGFFRKEALPVKVIDTTAAGEAFNAGVLYGLIKNWNLEKRLRFANTLAGLVISDPTGNYPNLTKVMKKMGGMNVKKC